jgi:hypothetical protein
LNIGDGSRLKELNEFGRSVVKVFARDFQSDRFAILVNLNFIIALSIDANERIVKVSSGRDRLMGINRLRTTASRKSLQFEYSGV